MDRPTAPENSLRLKLFYRLLPTASAYFRRRRMRKFARLLDIKPGLRVLDLGGTPSIWEHVETPLDITFLNLSGAAFVALPETSIHRFRRVEGDACRTGLADKSFDIVFSNSTIEHVGDHRYQMLFAIETKRLGRAYWVQTPSRWAPVEPHTGLPYWWFWPWWCRETMLLRWQKRMPGSWWNDYIAGTRVLSRHDMRQLFRDGRVFGERFLGLPRGLIACRSRLAATIRQRTDKAS